MKRLIKYVFVTIIFSFIFNIYVNAECSYKERTDLLNAAKSVDIGYEILTQTKEEVGVNPDTGEEMISTMNEYAFKFYVTNLPEKLYIRYYNNLNYEEHFITKNDLVDGIYYFEDNNYLNLYTYNFEFRSNNNNCLGDVFSTRKIVKPVYNSFELFSICDYEGMEDYKYCQKFITKYFGINENQFITEATKYYNSLNQNSDSDNISLLSIIINYWYYGAIALGIGAIIAVILFIRKKRSEL